jgi:predicted phage terminase large subunit-like protein
MIGADSPAQILADQFKAKTSLYHFSRWGFLQQRGYRWKRNWHHDLICAALERVFNGQCKRLIINIPPRYSKTELAVVNFIAWAIGKAPDAEFIHTSYSARLAANNSFRVREMLRQDWYRAIFPATHLQPGSEAKDDWRTTAGGVVYSTGSGGSITGYGAGKKRPGFGGAIIIDDPHKADEATSDTMRENVVEWFNNTLESRRNSPETPIILIMQRLHEGDLTGWLLGGGNGEVWEHLCIPVMNDPPSPLWPDDAPEELWPETHGIDDIRRMEQSKPYEFAGQYMQRPAPIGGGIFKIDWWRHYRPEALPPVRRLIQSWDTAFKTKAENDYSCCSTWAECESGYYLIDLWKERVEFPDLKRMVVSLAAKHSPHAVLVEDKASGQSLIQELRRDTILSIVPIKVDTDKVARAFAVTPLVESGRVFLPEGAPWVADYVSSLGTFPNAAHDDDVDSTTQALAYLSRGGGATGFLEFIRSEHSAVMAQRLGPQPVEG